MQIDMIW